MSCTKVATRHGSERPQQLGKILKGVSKDFKELLFKRVNKVILKFNRCNIFPRKNRLVPKHFSLLR